MTPGQYIRMARERRGYTLREAAAIVGLSHSHISDIERGVKALTPDTAQALCDVYGVSAPRALAMGGQLTPRAVEYLRARPEVGVMLDLMGAHDGKA